MTTELAAAPVSGPPGHRSHRRRRHRILLGSLAVAAALFVGPAVVDGWRVARKVGAGRAAFKRIVHEGLSTDVSLHDLARHGARDFADARAIALGSPWLSAWSHVPFLGRPARWLRAAAETTTTLSDAAASAIDRIEPRLRSAGEPGDRIILLDAVAAELGRLRETVEAIRLPSTGGFLPPVDSAGRSLRDDLDRLRVALGDGVAAARGLRSFLAGPSTYAVLAANNAEMRAGGMVLQVGLLRTGGGTIEAGGFRSTAALTLSRPVEVPDEIRALYGWLRPGIEWRSVGSSPNFTAVAPVYAAMAERAGLGRVDGVLQIDVPALRALLRVTGPVTVAGREYGPLNVERLVMHDLYAAFGDEAPERRHEFSELAAATFRALTERAVKPVDLVRALRSAAQGRHLLAWSSRAVEQGGWRALGIDGSIERDGLMLTVQNHTGNKLDWFLRPAMNLRVEQRPGKWPRAHLTIRISNPTPSGESRFVAGDGRLVPAGDYRAFVAVYLPGWAINVEMPGREVIVAGPDGPSRVVATRVDIARGASVTFEVAFSIPPDVDRIVLMPSARARPIPVRIGDRLVDDRVRRIIPM